MLLSIGLHRYFAAKGDLAAVVDYSRSDYEWNKLSGRPFRDFYVGNSHLGSGTGLQKIQRFREVYRIDRQQAERVAFAGAHVFGTDWNALDPASSVSQWTAVGLQDAPMQDGTSTLQVRNYDFGYRSFAEVYQRARQSNPGMRPPQPYNSTLLQCPWVDEAMQLGLDDARFRFESLPVASESARAATPEGRLDTCIRSPTVDCLLEQALEGARRERWMGGLRSVQFADVALSLNRPAIARQAMDEVLADRLAMTFSNPLFALPTVVKAEAEAQLGLAEAARDGAARAYAFASTPVAGYSHSIPSTLAELGPRLAKLGAIGEAQKASEALPARMAHEKRLTLEAMGLFLARSGDARNASLIADQLASLDPVSRSSDATDQIYGEISVSQARARNLAQSLTSLQRVGSLTARVWYLYRITKVGEPWTERELRAAIAKAWEIAFHDVLPAVSLAQGVLERRRIFHAYLSALRMELAEGALAAAFAVKTEEERTMLDGRTRPYAACAYWMAAAGLTDRARVTVSQAMGPYRQRFLSEPLSRRDSAQTLMVLAMELSEVETGERDSSAGRLVR